MSERSSTADILRLIEWFRGGRQGLGPLGSNVETANALEELLHLRDERAHLVKALEPHLHWDCDHTKGCEVERLRQTQENSVKAHAMTLQNLPRVAEPSVVDRIAEKIVNAKGASADEMNAEVYEAARQANGALDDPQIDT